ncbi:MAG: hypothetical protein WD423_00745 [Rhodothermales bacterium]
MSQPELLKRVVQALDELGIEYMITGSIASSLQGEPRSTHVIDLVVAMYSSDVDGLVNAFPTPDFYIDVTAARDAIAHDSMFNLIDVREGDKVDFWMLTGELFDRTRFSRKYDEEALGERLSVSAPEDTILVKLRWAAKMGGSQKQFTDALRVFEVQRESLNLAYLNRWASDLGLRDLWTRLQKEAEII